MENDSHKDKKPVVWDLKSCIIVITYIFAGILFILNIKSVGSAFMRLRKILTPFIIGFVIAYILNRPFNSIKNGILGKMAKSPKEKIRKMQKPLAIVITYLLVLAVTGGFVGIIIPNLVNSTSLIIQGLSESTSEVQHLMSKILNDNHLTGVLWDGLEDAWTEISALLSDAVSVLVPSLVSAISSITKGITQTVIGVIVSIYLLADKEHMKKICKKVVYAVLPKKYADRAVDVSVLTDKTFGSFIVGQLTVAAILGVLCCISMLILRMPYALLISVIVGFSNIIPYFGPFLGAVPGTFILLSVDPLKAVIFVILVIVLQQIDNNFISPRIVGGNLGLSGLWVLFAITVGGGIFGIPGMVISAPCFAVIYKLTRDSVNYRLKKKNVSLN